MKTILVICWGNIFRSPVAERLINRKLVELGLSEKIMCISRGIQGQGNIPAPRYQQFVQYSDEYFLAKPVLDQFDINIDSHIAQPLDPEILKTTDLIIPMDEKVTASLAAAFPEAEEKTVLFSDLENGINIEDPAESTNPNKYEQTIPRIMEAVEKLTPLLGRLRADPEAVREIKRQICNFQERK